MFYKSYSIYSSLISIDLYKKLVKGALLQAREQTKLRGLKFFHHATNGLTRVQTTSFFLKAEPGAMLGTE